MEVCGVCEKSFKNTEAYLSHKCTTGFAPTQPEHLGPEFAAISEAALARGAAKAGGAVPSASKPEESQSNDATLPLS